jgi:hypothetical protein
LRIIEDLAAAVDAFRADRRAAYVRAGDSTFLGRPAGFIASTGFWPALAPAVSSVIGFCTCGSAACARLIEGDY